jgi:hypothetical protein
MLTFLPLNFFLKKLFQLIYIHKSSPFEQSLLPSVNMSAFTAGGPISGLVRQLYGRILERLDHDVEILNEVKGIATANGPHVPHINSGSDETRSLMSIIEERYENLGAAFNRQYFIECNLTYFGCNDIKEAEEDFESAKALLEFRDDSAPIDLPMGSFITQVDKILKNRRFLPCVPDLTQEKFSFRRLQVSFLIFGIQFVVFRGINNVDVEYSRLKMPRYVDTVLFELRIVFVDKCQDYGLFNGSNSVNWYCLPLVFPIFRALMDQDHSEASGLLAGNKQIIARYLAYRQWRSSLFFNIAAIVAGLLFGKVITNFVQEKPGVAGFRVLRPMNQLM